MCSVAITSKDVHKFRDEMKAECEKLKDLKHKMKTFRECIERELRKEVRDIKNEKKEMADSLEFANGSVSELQKKLHAEFTKTV